MPKIVTIRPNKSEQKDINALMQHYEVGQATKALLKGATDVITMSKEIKKLKAELQTLRINHETLLEALKEKKAAESVIEEFLT